MARIAVTGAAGNVGRQVLAALEGHDVTAITHREHDDLESVVLEIVDRDAFVDALADHDVLVHLAANPSPEATWDAVREPNIHGTHNAYEAAVENDLDRVVFASSNHAVGTYNIEDPADPETMTLGAPRPVDPTDPPRPDSYYGVTKVAGEALGAYYAVRHDVEVVNLRIGWLMTAEQLAETQAEPAPTARFARAMWLSPRDCRDVVRRAALEPLVESPLTVHAVSRNDDHSLSLSETYAALGYRPRDNATEALDAQ